MSQVNINQPPPPEAGPPVAPADGSGIGFIVGILVAIVVIVLLVWLLLLQPKTPSNSTNNTVNNGGQTTPGPSGTRLVELAWIA